MQILYPQSRLEHRLPLITNPLFTELLDKTDNTFPPIL